MQPSSASSLGSVSLYKMENHFKVFKRDLAAYFAALHQWLRVSASTSPDHNNFSLHPKQNKKTITPAFLWQNNTSIFVLWKNSATPPFACCRMLTMTATTLIQMLLSLWRTALPIMVFMHFSSFTHTVLAQEVMWGGGRSVQEVEPAPVSVWGGMIKNTANSPVLSQTINLFWAQS